MAPKTKIQRQRSMTGGRLPTRKSARNRNAAAEAEAKRAEEAEVAKQAREKRALEKQMKDMRGRIWDLEVIYEHIDDETIDMAV